MQVWQERNAEEELDARAVPNEPAAAPETGLWFNSTSSMALALAVVVAAVGTINRMLRGDTLLHRGRMSCSA